MTQKNVFLMSVIMLFSLCGPKASAISIELIMFKFLQNLYFWLDLMHEHYFEQFKKQPRHCEKPQHFPSVLMLIFEVFDCVGLHIMP